MIKKRYLGDGVYAEIQVEMIKLTAENGSGALNTIYLEDPAVYQELVSFVEDAVKAAADAVLILKGEAL